MSERQTGRLLLAATTVAAPGLVVLAGLVAVAWVGDRIATANEGDYDGGSRGFTLFNLDGAVAFDSGNSLEHLAVRFGHYPDRRSNSKGTEPEAIGKHLEEVFTLYREDEVGEHDMLVSRVVSEDLSVRLRTMTLLAKDLSKHSVEGNAAPIKDASGGVIGTVLSFYPSDRARDASRPSPGACEESSDLPALPTLGAWVPLCSACKKVRDQCGDWHELESYFTDVWKFCFTHGMCPECLSRWYRRLGG